MCSVRIVDIFEVMKFFSVLNLGKSATTCSTQLTTYNEGEKLISYLHDSPQMKEKQVSNWEANLEDVLIQLRNQIEKERITHSTPDKLFILYTICRLVFDFSRIIRKFSP